MGNNPRDKSIRGGRKARRAARHLPDPAAAPVIAPSASPAPAAAPSFLSNPAASPSDPDPDFGTPNPSAGPIGNDDAGWSYFTEEQLEELVLKKLDLLYKDALGRLVSLGYDEDTALRAIFCSGHCYGSLDVLSNIIHNALNHLNSSPPSVAANHDSAAVAPVAPVPAAANGFTELRHLEEYSLAGMVCLLQQVRPSLTRGDAMWCLLMSNLHVGRASTVEIPPLPPSANTFPTHTSAPGTAPAAAPITNTEEFTSSINLCNFHAAVATAPAVGVDDVADPRRYDLPPSMKSAMRRNVSTFAPGTGFRPFIKPPVRQEPSDLISEQQQAKEEKDADAADRVENDSLDVGVVDSVLKALEGMSLDDNAPEDPKKEMIMDVIRQIRELEAQVKERKEWAQQKALQAARKLSNDLTELRVLRMEKEENQRLKKGKQALEDTTMKRLTEMENALKKVSGQVDRANAIVRRLETENAEIRAEIEASKLSASESARTCAEVARREKKCLKKLVAWEKQREKIRTEIDGEKKKVVQMERQLDELRAETKENEVKWKQEIKTKEEAIILAEEERRAKEAAKVNASRRLETLRRKIEIDCQRHKDDIQRLEEELARVKASAGSNQLISPSGNTLKTADGDAKSLKEANVNSLTVFSRPQESAKKLNRNRTCILCKKEEISVVFLPCCHQVTCASCNEDYDKKVKASCPCCNVRIEERIRVYGASS